MPVTSSARKAMRRDQAARIRNRIRIGKVRSSIKSFAKALKEGDPQKANVAFVHAQSCLAKGAKWGIIHRNRAQVKTARFAAQLHSLAS